MAPDHEANLEDPIFFAIAADPGLEQVVPYLIAHIASEVKASLHSLARLSRLLQAMFALTMNRTNNLGAYLPQALPAIITCLMSAKLGPARALSMLFASATFGRVFDGTLSFGCASAQACDRAE